MNYVYHFDIAAIMLTLMLILTVSLRKTYPSPTCKVYKRLLWLNLVASAADLISAFMIMRPYQVSLWVNYLVNVTYLTSHNLSAVLFMIYVLYLVRGNTGNKAENVLWKTIAVFDVLIIATSPLTKMVFYFDDDMMYQHGPMIFALYFTSFVLLVYSLIMFIRNRKLLTTFQMTTNIVFLSLLMGAIVFQYFKPNVLIESFCAALSFMMMNVALDNPEMYFYKSTSCFNLTAFNTTIHGKLKSGVKFKLVAFTYDDITVIRTKYGYDIYNEIVSKTIGVCHGLYGQKKVYAIGNATFVIDVDLNKDIYKIIDEICVSLSNQVQIDALENTQLNPHFCILHDAEWIKTVGDVSEIITEMLTTVYAMNAERIIFDDPSVLKNKRREETIILKLHDAIQNDGFEMYYQPIYDVKSNSYTSLEALIRLTHQDDDEYIGPDEFIPIAEKNGMIFEISAIVIEKVCKFWRDAKPQNHGIKFIETNLSMMQLCDAQSVECIIDTCKRFNVKPENINLEITETAATSGSEYKIVNKNIQYLIENGFTFSLDDFGSGYSNATYLAEIPFTIVKIDKNVLWRSMDNQNFRMILNNIMKMVLDIGRKCVVEGVETLEMIETVTQLGCDYLQGYYYSKPLSSTNIIDFLTKAE